MTVILKATGRNARGKTIYLYFVWVCNMHVYLRRKNKLDEFSIAIQLFVLYFVID